MNIYQDQMSESLGIRPITDFFPNYNFNKMPDPDQVIDCHWGGWHGMSHTEESKELIRQSKIGKLNPAYGKKLSDDHPFKDGYNTGKKFSEDHKQKMSQAKLGKAKTDSHKQAMSQAQKDYFAEKVECPHCHKYCSKNHWATNKFHFDNCKAK